MKIQDVSSLLNETVAPDLLAPRWDETVAGDDGGTPEFLMPARVARNRQDSALPPEADAPLLEAARRIAADRTLRLLARHCYRLLYDDPDYGDFASWPTFQPALGELGEVFYLLILLASAPRIRATHAGLGIPEAISQATCSRRDPAERFRATHSGRWGADRYSLYWMRHYVNGKLYRIGRMEYMLGKYNGNVEAYRNLATGETVALAPHDVCFNAQGLVVKPPVPDAAAAWTATLQTTRDHVIGFPVSPCGTAMRQQVRLPLHDWRRVLSKGDWTMDMHIPPGGKMTLSNCVESMRQGADFFKRFFPGTPFTSISCVSWIFNTQLEQILPPTANLVLFQRELYLYPVPSTGKDGFVFIFDRGDVTPETGPRETSLQRAILDFLAAGHTWRNGGMFFLVEDLPCFGRQIYRTQWEKSGLRNGGKAPVT